jgi:glycosyltransferase involved in cell wall biosynthesis
MKRPRITVYIVSHNYGRYLRHAVESVLRQTVGGWELFLVDDGSTDETTEVMELYRRDPRVRVLRTAQIGLPAIANRVASEGRGEYIVRLDADDWMDPNMLLVLSHHLDMNPDVALVFPDYFLIDDTGGLLRYEQRKILGADNALLDVPPNGACTMLRKSMLESIGGYREDLRAQDGFDIWSRLVKDFKGAKVDLPLFYYRRHERNLTDNPVRILSARQNIKRTISRDRLEAFRPITAVIPCRRNYDVFPDIWARRLGGRTLLDRTLSACLATDLFDNVVVTCDNEKARSTLAGHPDARLRFVTRSRDLTIPSCPIVNTLEHVLKECQLGSQGTTVLAYVQAPFTTTAHLEEAVYTLVMHDADASFCVEELDADLYRRTPHGLYPVSVAGKVRTDFDVVYADARTALAVRNRNIRHGNLMGTRIVNFVVPRPEVFFLHSRRDFEIARVLLRAKP